MSCRGEWRIAELYGLEAPPDARAHVAECADCGEFLDDARTFLSAYRSAPVAAPRRWTAPRRSGTAPIWAAAAAAIVVAALVLLAVPTPAPPGIAAEPPTAPAEAGLETLLSALPEPDIAEIDREIRDLRDAIRTFAETLESEDAL